MYSSHVLVAVFGLSASISASPLVTRQYPIICTGAAGETSNTQATIAIEAFFGTTWGQGQQSFQVNPSGYKLTVEGATIGVGVTQAGTGESLDIGVPNLINYWNAINGQCSEQTGGLASGYVVLSEDSNYAAYIN
ncbi:hypothetical protein A0O28_0019940 [Trichoderma guizhouense]|uniref:Uncharacterized protein n=1 Tax=Trichoderma guizhouense TaxID=1491466 RepID=A0A1T3CCQ4_9HYPO|nr:hypothetical protein A0O28_0019940 [Trichoderma guizhouense]